MGDKWESPNGYRYHLTDMFKSTIDEYHRGHLLAFTEDERRVINYTLWLSVKELGHDIANECLVRIEGLATVVELPYYEMSVSEVLEARLIREGRLALGVPDCMADGWL